MNIRPVTRADFDQFPDAVKRTGFAWAVEEKGRILGLAGYYMSEGRAVLYAEIKNDAREKCLWPARAMLTSGRYVLQKAIASGLPVYAVADSTVENSRKLLERLGFVDGYKETMVWVQPQSP